MPLAWSRVGSRVTATLQGVRRVRGRETGASHGEIEQSRSRKTLADLIPPSAATSLH
jgi:hypothetical protein